MFFALLTVSVASLTSAFISRAERIFSLFGLLVVAVLASTFFHLVAALHTQTITLISMVKLLNSLMSRIFFTAEAEGGLWTWIWCSPLSVKQVEPKFNLHPTVLFNVFPESCSEDSTTDLSPHWFSLSVKQRELCSGLYKPDQDALFGLRQVLQGLLGHTN